MTKLEVGRSECFYRAMQAMSDERRISSLEVKVDALEKKVDEGFVEMRDGFKEMRTEFRAVRGEMSATGSELRGEISALHRLQIQLFSGLFLTMILGFAGILLQHHL